ncbi:MAG TPA: Asp-tRNA(Asn)/Glu-tRNA(Gln) amidotransferase subunit GatC [Burkholderiales bacterium]|nr:Asp-tRNA(Asn)/Glu-tRNA(Gln) amidotransferase subunit GatC [Burkholderiales bacterium]
MSLTPEQVQRIALLARIELSEADLTPVRDKLNDIFAMIEQMQAVDTAGIAPMSHAQDLSLRLREDAVTEEDRHILYQSGAPRVENGLYLVPKVIE